VRLVAGLGVDRGLELLLIPAVAMVYPEVGVYWRWAWGWLEAPNNQ